MREKEARVARAGMCRGKRQRLQVVRGAKAIAVWAGTTASDAVALTSGDDADAFRETFSAGLPLPQPLAATRPQTLRKSPKSERR
jgi:hypothetical protein